MTHNAFRNKILTVVKEVANDVFNKRSTINILEDYLNNDINLDHAKDFVSYAILMFILSDDGFVEVNTYISPRLGTYAEVVFCIDGKNVESLFYTEYEHGEVLPKVFVHLTGGNYADGSDTGTLHRFYSEFGHKTEYLKVPAYVKCQQYANELSLI